MISTLLSFAAAVTQDPAEESLKFHLSFVPSVFPGLLMFCPVAGEKKNTKEREKRER